MKAKQIRRLRKRISEKGYYEKQLETYKKKMKEWRSFEQFSCSSFFNGYELAEYNQKVYDKYYPICLRKFKYYARKAKL